MEFIKNLKRQLERNQGRLKDYESRKNTLSIHGYQQLGYLQGKIAIQEQVLDSLEQTFLEHNNSDDCQGCSHEQCIFKKLEETWTTKSKQ